MARTNRILNLSECNAYEAPFQKKKTKTFIENVASIFPVVLKWMDTIFVICIEVVGMKIV